MSLPIFSRPKNVFVPYNFPTKLPFWVLWQLNGFHLITRALCSKDNLRNVLMGGDHSALMHKNGRRILANEGTETWVFVKNIVNCEEMETCSCSIPVSYYRMWRWHFHFMRRKKKSWWALTWRGHEWRLLWCWTLSVLAVQLEARVWRVLRGSV